jgi:hypothetical protein
MIDQLITKAKEKDLLLTKNRKSLRFKKILGRLVAMNLLRTTDEFILNQEKMKLNDLLWAGQFEPRILELIPAIAVKKPSVIAGLENAPQDLKTVISEIKSANPVSKFRHVNPKDYLQWLGSVGQRKKKPTKLKSFRFQQDDLVLLNSFKLKGMSEIEAVRRGLKLLAQWELDNTAKRNNPE